jgi:hypothetical protein
VEIVYDCLETELQQWQSEQQHADQCKPRAARPEDVAAVTDTNVTTEEVLDAYFSCARNKRRKPTTIDFEADLFSNIMEIVHSLNDHSWAPSSAMCFAVTQPRAREIWAARFADRVVHHVVYRRLRPRFEPHWARTSFACIEGRGSLAAANWAERKIRSATAGWTREAFALQCDIANFFPSIDRDLLVELVLPKCHEPWVASAMEKVIRFDVQSGAHYPGNPALLERVAPHKRLSNSPAGKGLPIGNLTSQFCANIYLDVLDQYVTRTLRPRAYGRYVDDILIVDTDIKRLERLLGEMSAFLEQTLLLEFHPDKTSLKPCADGVDFVGWVIAPHRRTLRRTTVQRGTSRISSKAGDDLLASANSYFGLAQHGNTYRVRQSWADLIDSSEFYVTRNLGKVTRQR